jgi:CBS domain-containing protein
MLAAAQQRMITIHAHATLVVAAKLLSGTHRALLIVCDANGAMVGVITKTDIVRQVAQCLGVVDDVKISDVMTRTVTSCRRDDALSDVLGLMKTQGFVHIPVIDQKVQPCGVVNTRDALQALLGEARDEELLLRAYVMGIGHR